MTEFLQWLREANKITEINEYKKTNGVQRVDFRLTYDGALGMAVTVFVANSPRSAHLAERKARALTGQGYVQMPHVGLHRFAMGLTQQDRLVLAVLPQGVAKTDQGYYRGSAVNDYKAVKFLLHLWWCLKWNYENPAGVRELPQIKGETGAAHKKAGYVGMHFGREFEQLMADIYSCDANLELFRQLTTEDGKLCGAVKKELGFCFSEFETMLSIMLPSQDWEEVADVSANVLPAAKEGHNYKADVLIQFKLRDNTTITTTVSLKCPCNNKGANIANGESACADNFLLKDLGLDYDSPADRELISIWSCPSGANWDEEALQAICPDVYNRLQTVKQRSARQFLLNQVFGKEDPEAPTQAMALLTDHLDAGHGFLYSKSYVTWRLGLLTDQEITDLFTFFPSTRKRIKTPQGIQKGEACLRVKLLTNKFKQAMRGH